LVDTTGYRLRAFFPDLDELLSQLTDTRCKKLYDELTARTKTDTHRNSLAEVKTFLSWCVKEGWLPANPAAKVEPTGKRKKGKKQHRPSEASQFYEQALVEAAAGSDGSFAAAVVLALGLRQNAITHRRVRDVDVLTHKLFIEGDKSDAGERSVKIPDDLWPHFAARIEERGSEEPLLPAASRSGFHQKGWVNDHTKRLCSALELPAICGHALRGTHASIAEEGGVTGEAVVKQLGHRKLATTRGHYSRVESVEAGRRDRVLRVLSGGEK
jgi:integrase